MKMTIKEIRNVIDASSWLRNDFSGHTAEEFRRADVGPRLTAKIEALKALEIPARFVQDIERRDTEITYCLRVIGRWEAARAAGPRNNGDVAGLKLAAVVGPVLTVIQGGRA